jgi:murein DD-endopeptidase MepM/ murein hydrolase activator NlpD
MYVQKVKSTRTPKTEEGFILPFEGAINISQGYNGPYSHFAYSSGSARLFHDMRFCLDFAVPTETEILAARSGIVYAAIDVNDDFYQGVDSEIGLNVRTNFLLIAHKDRTLTLYSHLAKDGIVVRRGQHIEQGQPLARTGLSGWVGPRPHLHFALLKDTRRSLPVIFDDYSGPLEHKLLS